ncbi:DNA methyltransferase [Antrihabitans cavernicola]|uniref:DNA methylase n=1 Tax=Antrihabitans cavernicola TaxID=2495913 RepID=A0A5A7SJH0_9NOCA|nr:DNA methyltransferase [Spelaeibacter cavernicola]KAA0024907.1 DNA methylase [Spelaeibacter cavernicola]
MSAGDIATLYETPLAANRTGALYNAFSYPTKISAESIALFIACHTAPGDHVLDVFGGSGSTGIAALLCERPTDRMLTLAAERGLNPTWGARDTTVYELSEIGTLLARVMTKAPEPTAFRAAANHLVDAATNLEPSLYVTEGPDGQPGTVRHVIWSDVVECPGCGTQTTYADIRVRYQPLRFDESHTCACGHTGSPDEWSRVLEHSLDPWTGETATRRRRVPWKVYGTSKAGNWSRSAVETDSAGETDSLSRSLPTDAPLVPLTWGDLHRSGYHQGMTHLHHLYTARNFRAVATLWHLVDDEPEELRDALRLLVLSYNAAHSTLMTRVVLKKNSPDFVITGAQSGVMYVSGLPVEKNVFVGVRRKIATFAAAFDVLHGLSGQATVVTGSATKLHLADESVDYVFTDPPFGAYIPYSEVNQPNELWLGRTTRTDDEAIISPAQGKGIDEYRSLLTSVFSEVARVMSPTSEATLVFHSSQASVWRALAASVTDAGLTITAASILDKTQASFKQVNGHVAVSGDPLLRISKCRSAASLGPASTMSELVRDDAEEHADGTPTLRDPRHKFSELIGKALVGGIPITMDARAVYELQGSD